MAAKGATVVPVEVGQSDQHDAPTPHIPPRSQDRRAVVGVRGGASDGEGSSMNTTTAFSTEHYRALFTRQWWIVAVCVIGVGIGAFLGSRYLTRTSPTYTSTALVEADVVGAYSDFPGYLATEAKLATSSKILSVLASNNAGLSTAALANEITANNLTGTH